MSYLANLRNWATSYLSRILRSSIIQSSLLGWSARLFNMLFQMFSIRAVLDKMGTEGYAGVVLITGLLGWMANLDFGYSYGLMNAVAETKAKRQDLNDLKILSLICYLAFSLLCLALAVIIAPLTANTFLSAVPDGNRIGLLMASLVILGFVGIGNIGNRLLFADQHINLYYSLSLISTAISSVYIALCSIGVLSISILMVIAATFIPQILVSLVAIIFFCRKTRFVLPDLNLVRQVSITSLKFLGLNFLTLMTVSTDTFIISQCLSAHDISVYGLYNKFFLSMNLMIATSLGILWPRFTAYAVKNEWGKIRSSIRMYLIYSILGMIAFGLFIYFLNGWIISVLAPHQHIYAPAWFVLALTLLQISILWTGAFNTAIISMSILTPSLIFTPIQAIIAGLGEWYLSKKFGVVGIPIGLLISYVVFPIWLCPLLLWTIVHKSRLSSSGVYGRIMRFLVR